MNWIGLFAFIVTFFTFPPLWAVPATLENLNYKVTLSETMPGLDDQGVAQSGPTITATIEDKLRSSHRTYQFPVYAIHDYFLEGDNLNLLCRVTPKGADGGARYSFLQLNLSSPSNSRRYQALKQFSFSPGNQYLLGVFDGKGKDDSIGLIQLGEEPAKISWLYSPGYRSNPLQKASPSMVQGIALQDPVGWSADSATAVFVASAQDSFPGTPTGPPSKDYLVFVELDGDHFNVVAKPVDLSPYHYRTGSALSDIKCTGDKATLFFTPTDSSDILQADFPIPTPVK